MLVLLLSPVPMVRGFGVLLVVGVAIALLCALTAGAAALSLSPLAGRRAHRTWAGDRAPGRLAWRGARRAASREPPHPHGARLRSGGRRCAGPSACWASASPWPRWAGGSTPRPRCETDITKLVPQSLGSLQALNTLERTTGVGGEVDVMVSGRDLAKPGDDRMDEPNTRSAVLTRFGYSDDARLRQARLCPAFSLPDLFQTQARAGTARPKLTAGRGERPARARSRRTSPRT